MINKLKKIEDKERFYTACAVSCGKSIKTMTALWFNQTKGFSIPVEYHKKVDKLLDDYLRLEERVRNFEKKELEKMR